ncbi:hypothetical protein GCM10027449_30460 [Sinomonas notoginsengisoli]|uniref:type II toxin-antitoxin system PemK/MazF family toxin n=1 Tax=Sinomonas notoginsengisoli TaxID=1457311 RepID=UPI001F420022|nr:type II toxin-antitoxin system PemK/MazF family toxin [Sinomonas notoginsengisoli]
MLRSLASRFVSAVRSALGTEPRLKGRATPLPAHDGERLPGRYAGDFTGKATVEYRPDPDGEADPGEIVWTWVPYEEDHSQGKDRPVLIVGRHASALLALMLTSRDHDGRARQADYIDIGTGDWDPQRRPSEVRIDRVLQIDPRAVRREGAVLARARFDLVASGLRTRRGWQ